ncbi:MAG: type II CAAX endopeptidase family protein [Bacteroidota bacterium]
METELRADTPPRPQYASLSDAWEQPDGAIPLNGLIERQQFPPWLTALFGIFLALILFHFIVGPIATFGILMAQGIPPMEVLNSLETVIAENAKPLLIANTIGQVLALALPFLIIAGWHSRKKWAFLRFRTPNWSLVGLSVFGLVGLTPIAWWLGNLNAQIPLPDAIRQLEESQLELIEQVLQQDLGLVFSLAVMALTPAICEEILFRGYLQRQFERAMGVLPAIVLIGVIFGFFHLRFTQVIPLSVIGIYLAYITWRSGSLWLAIIIHFANNAFAVCLGIYLSGQSDVTLEELERMQVPVPALIAGFLILAAVLYMMEKIARDRIGAAGNAAPVVS